MKGGAASNSIVVGLVVALSMVLLGLGARQTEALNCGQVEGVLLPCLSYLIRGGTPSSLCCNGLTRLRDLTPTKQDRQTACQCVKDAAEASHMRVDPDAASHLPGLCGIPVDLPPITSATDCHTIP